MFFIPTKLKNENVFYGEQAKCASFHKNEQRGTHTYTGRPGIKRQQQTQSKNAGDYKLKCVLNGKKVYNRSRVVDKETGDP